MLNQLRDLFTINVCFHTHENARIILICSGYSIEGEELFWISRLLFVNKFQQNYGIEVYCKISFIKLKKWNQDELNLMRFRFFFVFS